MRQPPRPSLTPKAEAARAEREARLADALRKNLRRRKAAEAPKSALPPKPAPR
jgi:uncharacterized membrane protein